MKYKKRIIIDALSKSIETRPLTYVNGARQVGKSTLCANIPQKANHITFDSPIALIAAKNEPEKFVNSLPSDTINVIDEVQFAPEIFPYLKMKIDENRLKGNDRQKFLLTGSADIMAMPRLSEALVGRMSVLTLYPFSSNEYFETAVSPIKRLFDEDLKIKTYPDYEIKDIIKKATFPEISLNAEIERTRWFDSYLTTLLNRDVRALSDLKNADAAVTVLSLLSMRTGGLLNNAQIAGEIGIDIRTYEKLYSFALNSYMIFNVKSWAKPNKLNKRFIKSPKLYFTDTNFLCYIMRRSLDEIYDNDKIVFGHIFENFIAAELLKNAKYENIELSYFRTLAGKEADFVLENENGDIIGVEVKTSSEIGKKHLAGLKELKEITGEKFKKGVVIYPGKDIVPIDGDIWAIPACYLWS